MIISVPILKDEEQEHPVPTHWRSKLKAIADAIKDGNYSLSHLADVVPLDADSAAEIAQSIANYGCSLKSLPSETWNTSVCQWQLDHWQVLVDLFTVEEGRSDLALDVCISEKAGEFVFNVHCVYVP